jgi:hypothetical protein
MYHLLEHWKYLIVYAPQLVNLKESALTGRALFRGRNVFPVRCRLYLCVPYDCHNKQRLFLVVMDRDEQIL